MCWQPPWLCLSVAFAAWSGRFSCLARVDRLCREGEQGGLIAAQELTRGRIQLLSSAAVVAGLSACQSACPTSWALRGSCPIDGGVVVCPGGVHSFPQRRVLLASVACCLLCSLSFVDILEPSGRQLRDDQCCRQLEGELPKYPGTSRLRVYTL